MKRTNLIIFLSCLLMVMAICLSGCLPFAGWMNMLTVPEEEEEYGLGERYDSDKVPVCEDTPDTTYKDRLAWYFDQYSEAADEVEFVVHEATAIAIAEAVMNDLRPEDNFGMVDGPSYWRHCYYYIAENCWEVQLHKNARTETLSTDEMRTNESFYVYIDVNSGAVRAIIPSSEFSVDIPANAEWKEPEE